MSCPDLKVLKGVRSKGEPQPLARDVPFQCQRPHGKIDKDDVACTASHVAAAVFSPVHAEMLTLHESPGSCGCHLLAHAAAVMLHQRMSCFPC